MLHAFMIGSGQPVRTEVQSASGRSDIVLDYPERRLVLELKYAETEKECEERLTEAVSQIKKIRRSAAVKKICTADRACLQRNAGRAAVHAL